MLARKLVKIEPTTTRALENQSADCLFIHDVDMIYDA